MQAKQEDSKLYEPIHFVYDGVIGPKKQQSQAIVECSHKYLVKPQLGYQMIDYVLFHTAATFNWLKTVETAESSRLTRYLNGQSANQHLRPGGLMEQMKDYCERWDIMKVGFMARFYITQAECRHLNKKIVWSIDYVCKGKRLQLLSHRCKQCQKDIVVRQAELKECPDSMILKRKEKQLVIAGDTYEPYLLMNESKKQVAIRVAGQWYLVGNGLRVIGEKQALENKSQLYFYSRKTNKSEIYRVAEKGNEKVKKVEKAERVMKEDKEEEKKPKRQSHPQVISKSTQKLRPLPAESYEVETYVKNEAYTREVKNSYAKEKKKDEYDIEYDKGKVKKVRLKKINKKINFNDLYRKLKSEQNRHNQT